MSTDHYDFNEALNHEAALILVSDGCPPATFDSLLHVTSLGFLLGRHPEITPENPRVLILILAPGEELALAERPDGLAARKAALRAACAKSLAAAGWELGERGPILAATAPREAVAAALSAVLER
ncbi:hypothetical protein ABZ864_40670 [Streptomyces sp. NPDC047082]|uniref:hypothetical protein n=1 Tax=Streptomyces sp. NPDC047082 TaxID=3155259 RepID=UPI0033EE238B